MTNQEFSDTFTTLLNSNSEVAQFGDQDASRDINLTEYEKSVFLSLAEEDILKSYFNRNLNPHDQGFDDTERRQIEYSSLVKVTDLKPLEEKKTTNSSSSTDTDITPTRRLLAAKPVLRASSSSETILVDNTDWLQGLGAISVKKDIYLSQGAGSILVGYNNRYGAYLTTYFGEYLEPDTPGWITMEQVVVDNQTCFRFTFEENVTGASRKTRFFMFLNARDPKSGKMGSEYFGIGIDIIQVGGEDKYVTIGSIESFGYDGGRQIIPITFSDGSSVLDHVQNGDIDASYVLRDWEVNPNLWFTFAFVEGGIAIECEKNYSIYENNLGGTTYTPYKERSKPMIISVANVLNAQSKSITITQEAAPVNPDETSPYEVPYAVKKSTQIELDAAGETKVDTITPNKAGDFTITVLDTANIPSWLTVQVSGNSLQYTCEANTTGEMRKTTVEFIVQRAGTGDSTTTATFLYQPSSFEMIDLGVSSDPQAIYFDGEFDNAHPEGHVVKPVIPNGYGFKFDVHGDFFRPSYHRSQIDVYLTSANETGAVKHGTIEIYLTSQTTRERIPGIESFFVDVYQSVKTATTTEGDAGQAGQSEDLMISCKPGPSNGEFEFGANGGDKAFDKFWWTGGNITKIAYELIPSWFTLRKDSKYINTDTGDSKTHYNPFGYYIHCEKNETGVARRSYVEVTIKGSGISTMTSKIYVNQAAEEIQPDPVEPDPEHPVPVITCADTLNVPAHGYEGIMLDGKVRVFLPIALENADDYEVSVVTAGNIISKINKYDDGISVWCNDNIDNARTASIKITARNGYSSTVKTVTVRQAGESDQQPVPDIYVKIDRHDVTVKSYRPNTETITVDTNASYINVEIHDYDGDSGSDDWCQYTYVIDNRYEFEFYDMFDSGTGRTAKVDFVFEDDEIVRWDTVLFHQPAKPKITLAKDSEDNFTWAGGKIEVPISLVGLQFADIYIKEKGIWVDPAIDAAGRKLIVSVAQNTSNAERGHIIVLEGTNELGETATATFTINQGQPPVYTGGDDVDSGSGSSESQTPEYVDQTYTVSKFDDRSLIFRLPRRTVGRKEQEGTTDVLFILNEKLIVPSETKGRSSTDYTIKPISYLEYDRIMSRAYNYPMKRQAWRLFQNQTTGFDIISEIIPANAAASVEGIIYRLRYVRRPKPIVLTDLPDGLTIDGYNTVTTCELNPMLHMDVVVRAVQLALASRSRQFVASNNEQK